MVYSFQKFEYPLFIIGWIALALHDDVWQDISQSGRLVGTEFAWIKNCGMIKALFSFGDLTLNFKVTLDINRLYIYAVQHVLWGASVISETILAILNKISNLSKLNSSTSIISQKRSKYLEAIDWCFLQHEKQYSEAIVRFSDNSD